MADFSNRSFHGRNLNDSKDSMFKDRRQITDEEAWLALDFAVEQVGGNLPLYTDRCQNHSSVNGIYPACENVQWTCGFWPGEIWLAWEHTCCGRKSGHNDSEAGRTAAEKSPAEHCAGHKGSSQEYRGAERLGDEGGSADSEQAQAAVHAEKFRAAAMKLVESFEHRIEKKIEVDHHDMGFLYTPSCVAAWKLTGDERAKNAAILAADQLMTRFQKKGEFFQAWGKLGEPGTYRYIIDCLMNLPLLYWASETTGDPRYQEAARRHITTCMRYSFRADGSTYHTFFMNQDGTPSHGETCQGYKDDSFWARGQAWGVYGSVLSYRYDPKPEYLDIFHRALDFYLSRLPEDLVPYWDMVFSDGSGEPRDSSSAAIVVCGLLEARRYLPEEEAQKCEVLARQMLYSLTKNYTVWGGQCLPETDGDKNGNESDAKPGKEPGNDSEGKSGGEHCEKSAEKAAVADECEYAAETGQKQKKITLIPGAGLLLHGTYSKKSPYNTCTEEGVDEYTSWGDYFYMEALTRLTRDWKSYW
ncbi:MAG: glycoside hydrolase family 88 protein [Lachnospiraceae bacterium]|nr:glycoside hydrolase family 88 protein [Lachnospiraceae bacterium]